MKPMSKKSVIPWLISLTVLIVTAGAIALNAAGVAALSEGARNALGVTVATALVVFGYTSCKYAGVLKGQTKK